MENNESKELNNDNVSQNINENLTRYSTINNNTVDTVDNTEKIIEDTNKEITVYEGEKEVRHNRREKNNTTNKNKHIIIIAIIALVITVISIFVMYMLSIKFETKLFNNVYILNENVSGYSTDKLEKYLIEKNKTISQINLELYHNNKKVFTVYPSNIELEIDINKTLKNAFSYGRSSNDFMNTITIIKNINKNININTEYKYNKEKLEEIIKNIDLSLEDRCINDTYTIDDKNNNLILIKGSIGNSINYDEVSNKILECIASSNTRYGIDVIEKSPEVLDIDKIYGETNKDSVNAYINEEKKVVKEINGYKLDKQKIQESLNDLKGKSAKEEIIIPLEVILAQISTKDLNYSEFNDKIEGATTYFNSADKNRSKNIETGLKYINDKVVLPGEIFSFNDTVGEITRAKGYLEGITFSGGKMVKGIGGGICQVSSTLYNAVLKSNLEVVTRYAHSLPVGYVLPSLDATIYIGMQDFKFKNTREYPIKIIASYNRAGSLNISIYGVKEDVEYDIKLESIKLQTIYAKTKYIYDNNLQKGQEQIVYKGSNGIISESYIVKYLNGKVVSKQLLSRDTYGAQDKVIKVGTKENKVNIY